MAIKEIKKYPDSTLNKKAAKIEEITLGLKELISDMAETMRKSQGIGLAAPQVGVLKKVIIIQEPNGAAAFINPEIVQMGKKTEIGEEGCLSLPGLYLKIKRAKEITIAAKNVNGEDLEIKADGLLARVFQHEIDHLNGILIFDRLSFWQKIKIKKNLKERLTQNPA